MLKQNPFNPKLVAEAESIGLVLFGASDKSGRRRSNYRKYKMKCGHICEIRIDSVRRGLARCGKCGITVSLKKDAQDAQDAQEAGIELICADPNENNVDYNLYMLPCGHEKSIKLWNVKTRQFKCQKCSDTYVTQKSNVYLLKITCGDFTWLKLGHAKHIQSRLSGYKLDPDAIIDVLAVSKFKSGESAREFEGRLHQLHKQHRLKPEIMRQYHECGFTECYPVYMEPTLSAAVLLNESSK